MRRILLIAALALTAFAGWAVAEDRPLWSVSRLQLAAGLNYEAYNAWGTSHSALPDFKREYTVGIYGSYNLIEELDLVGYGKVGLDNHIFSPGVGIRYTFFAGAPR